MTNESKIKKKYIRNFEFDNKYSGYESWDSGE